MGSINWTKLLCEWGYWAVLVGTFLKGESILVLAAAAAHKSYLNIAYVLAATLLGFFSGDQLYFFRKASWSKISAVSPILATVCNLCASTAQLLSCCLYSWFSLFIWPSDCVTLCSRDEPCCEPAFFRPEFHQHHLVDSYHWWFGLCSWPFCPGCLFGALGPLQYCGYYCGCSRHDSLGDVDSSLV